MEYFQLGFLWKSFLLHETKKEIVKIKHFSGYNNDDIFHILDFIKVYWVQYQIGHASFF